MKEATGELNMTVVTVVAIVAIAAFFYAFVWPAIQKSIESGTKCAAATGCVCTGNICKCQYDGVGIECAYSDTAAGGASTGSSTGS